MFHYNVTNTLNSIDIKIQHSGVFCWNTLFYCI